MNRYRIKVHVEIEESDQALQRLPLEQADGSFELVLSEPQASSIDECEQALLRTNYAAVRQALAAHLTTLSKKKAQEYAREYAEAGEVVIAHETPYRVDGEVGRFAFTTHGIGKGGSAPVHHLTGREFFPPLQGQQWYQTRGFKELALVHGVVEDSYRKTSALINRVRHQPEATSARQLCDTSEREGQQILSHLEQRADQILVAHDFTEEGRPPELMVRLSGSRGATFAEEAVQQAISRCELAAELKGELAANPLPYEVPAQQVYVAVDLVGVNHQKAHRPSTDTAPAKPGKPPQTYTTIAQVRNADFSYVLAGKGVVGVLRLLLALLLHNCLWNEGLIFLTDGQKTLHAAILNAFGWWGSLRLILDWYHLEKKCKEGLSLALNGRAARNATLEKLRPLLWHGLTDRTIQLLQALDPQQVKNEAARQQLLDYLHRCKPHIPCYAVRKQLGLPNGSSIGEKMNDLLVAQRQKHNGMSWSAAGSVALAALTAMIRNGESQTWFKKQTLALKLKLAA